jgi:hypothetical protein
LERNAAAKGVVDNINYVGDAITGKRSPSEVKDDALRVFQDQFVEPVTKAALDQFTNPLAYTSEEAYEAGRANIETNVIALEAAATVASGGAAAAARASRMLTPDMPNGRRAGVGGASLLERFAKQGAKPDSGGGVKKITTNAIVLPKSLSELEAYLQTLASRMNHAIARNNPFNHMTPQLGIAGIGRMDFSDHHRDLDNNRSSYSFYENRKDNNDQYRKEKGEKEGTGEGSDIPKNIETVSYDKVYPTRQLDVDGDRYIIDKVIEYKSKLSKTLLKKDGNFAFADVDITGIDKKDFYSYSSLHKTSGNPNYEGFSVKPDNPKFESTHAPDAAGVIYKRDADTEYKILNDIAERIEKLKNEGINIPGGKIRLFTEKDTCGSCSKIIRDFSETYNIDIEVIHNAGKPIDLNN